MFRRNVGFKCFVDRLAAIFGFSAGIFKRIISGEGWGNNAISTAVAVLLGLSLLFAFGLLVLSMYVMEISIYAGINSILPGEAVKLVILAVTVPYF